MPPNARCHGHLEGLCWRLRLIVSLLCCALSSCTSDGDQAKRDASSDTWAGEAGVDTRVEIPDSQPLMDRDAASAPDQPIWPPSFNMGEGCLGPSECKEESPKCIFIHHDLDQGVCSRPCSADNPDSDENEDTCPPGFICSIFPSNQGITERYCLRECTPSLTQNPCPPSSKLSCSPLSLRYSSRFGRAVCLYKACVSHRDCPVYSSLGCGSDGECSSLGSDAFCAGSICAKPGNCTSGGICGPHPHGDSASSVGSPCANDLQCPGNGYCLAEQPNPAGGHPHYPNGYCTVPNCSFADALPEFACPADTSSCSWMFNGGLCLKTCALSDASGCRGYSLDRGGDYECYAYNHLIIGEDRPITSQPVCASAAAVTCSNLGPSITCANLGEPGNPTNMTCRDSRTGEPKILPNDISGVCLDDTASGPFEAQ